ncbi:hypothetical protein C2S52_022380 [Perilla frutescens var. hirtella]|nr:hypothetical protein C2S52_022380 [Perilla frutescens var. hirtella]
MAAEMGNKVSLFSAAVDLVTLLLFLCILPSVSTQFSDERMVLVELKRSFSDPYGILDSWNAGSSNHCSWFGVSCNSDFRVSMLKIGGNLSRSPSCSIKSEPALHGFGIARKCSDQSEIGGTLSAVIGKFKYLRVLSLPFNKIGGEIPVEIWGLRSLEVLDLEGNGMYGHLSSFGFSGLRKLRVLNLASNRIFGKFPPSLSECKSLRILNLAGNRINDVIPGFVGGFGKLRVVNLSFNRLVGYVPSNFGYDCGNLEHLDLSRNFLKGEIPRALGKCSRLRTVLLSSNALYGVIPNELGKLQNLEVLNVARNRLGGPLPANLGNCSDLSVIVLSSHLNALRVMRPPRGRAPHGSTDAALDDHNSFEGSIPDEITTLPKLKILWAPGANFEGRFPRNWGNCKSIMMVNLAQNHFTGDIFGLFSDCTDLQYLNLSSNKLSGKLDENLPSCVTMFDVSGNMLSGPIPSFNTNVCHLHPYDPSVAYAALLVKMSHEMLIVENDYPNAFLGLTATSFILPMPPVNGLRETSPQTTPAPPPDASNDDHSNSSSDHGGSALAMASIVAASAAGSFILVSLFLYCCKSRKGKEMAMTTEISASPQRERVIVFNDVGATLTYDSIVHATENFHRRYCIGNGGFGKTYRAEVAPGNSVAVKRLTAERHQGAAQFHAEVSSLGQIKHPNLITLLGYYSCGPEMFLIYNYLPGGNLDRFIRDRARRVFNYSILHKIALHIATALWYLHDQCDPRILHRDIKPSNILLDDDSNAFLADFGLCKILATSETHATTRVAGTYGYISPEYALTGRVSDRADVYSYGVVLLELLSDKRALDPSFYSHEDGFNIVSWACMMLNQDRSDEVFTASLWDTGPRDKLVKMLHVAVLCTVDSVSARPSMRHVVHRLKQIQPE